MVAYILRKLANNDRQHQVLTRTLAVLQGLAAVLIWSSTFVFTKMVLPSVGPITVNGIRFTIGSCLLLPFTFKAQQTVEPTGDQKVPGRMSIAIWRQLALMALLWLVLGNTPLQISLRYIPSVMASFIVALMPLPALLYGVILLHEKPVWWQIMGAAIGMAGIVLFFLPNLSTVNVTGVLIASISLFSIPGAWIISRGLAQEGIGAMIRTSVPMGISGIVLLIFGLLTEAPPQITLRIASILLLLGVVNSMLGYLLYNASFRELSVIQTGILGNLMPIGTAIIARFLLDERLKAIQVIGMVVTILGIFLVQWENENKESANAYEET